MMCDAIYDQKKFGTNIYDLTETFVLLEEMKKNPILTRGGFHGFGLINLFLFINLALTNVTTP